MAREALRLPLFAAAFAAATLAAGCAPPPDVTPPPVPSRAAAHVQNHWLELRLSRPPHLDDHSRLVLFVTGDGGWRGKDLEAFRHMVEWGYPVAGFSAPEYLDNLANGAESLSPRELAQDFHAIIATATKDLELAFDTQVLLTGVSRGADLVVIAAADPLLRETVAGTLAVALTDEEESVRHPRWMFHRARAGSSRHDAASTLDPDERVIANPYDVLPWIQGPVAVVQSTRDRYVPAAVARELFGPDGPTRRFSAIEARNHSFGGSRDQLYEAMHASLDWLASSRPAPTSGSDP